ncbi:shikimate dehydrogenase family protein [Bradyrhizobium zhanjiangense]|uniref:Shikimate dehydrogenase n=1 Tax=Bradyrhizobium zhanjiangense TaxID=1325107 RepID=A0A4Q0QS46_9BRAD|nr:ThiF family adenylyltransferase [Bradyrhizobium zhanjiangense]RXG99357.1 shikimate dehydrogenase [Bradyrhizobium zhanjiangense]
MISLNLTGATRLNIIVGDPIAQVKSPAGVTQAFVERGYDGILVPVQIDGGHLKALLTTATEIRNLDGIIVTVPHKFACYEFCSSATDRARLLGSVNIMRRRREGGWHGDHVDGLGFVGAVRADGYDPAGKRALLVGAGGAGSAIAMALVEAGVRTLAIHDNDVARRDQLIGKLKTLGRAEIVPGSADPSGFDLIANATPLGMKAGDPLPLDVSKLEPEMFVGCVITSPVISPLVEAARFLGCKTSTGSEMYNALQSSMVDFLLARDGSR